MCLKQQQNGESSWIRANIAKHIQFCTARVFLKNSRFGLWHEVKSMFTMIKIVELGFCRPEAFP